MDLRSLLAVAVAGCGFSPTPEPPRPMTTTIVDDTAADFSGMIEGGVIAARGAIEPHTYVAGGLHARGYKVEGVTMSSTYAELVASLPAPSGEAFGVPLADWGSDVSKNWPHGLGIAQGDHFTAVFDGEVWLPAGPTILIVSADDAGFFEIDIDGALSTIRASVGTGTLTVTTAHEGWYPIRGAFTDTIGDARLQLFDVTNAVTSVIAPTRFRARTTDERGLVTYAYFLEELLVGPGIALERGPLDHAALAPGPSDWGLTTTFSLRYAGQLLVETTGTYVAAVDVGPDGDDGFRLWIDGEVVAAQWLTVPTKLASDPLVLAAGWHSIMVDYGQNTGNAEIHLKLGADASSLAVVAADHLRPTVAHATVNAFGSSQASAWNDNGSASYDMAVAVSGGEIIDALDLEYALTGPRTIALALEQEGGTPDPIAIHPTANERDFPGSPYDYDAGRPGWRGQTLGPKWHLRATDVPDGVGGAVAGLAVITYHGGPLRPFEQAVTYTSPPRETPGATAFVGIHVLADLQGSTLAIAMRTAADVAGLDAAAWIPVVNDEVPPVAPGAVVQYQLAVTGDGWQFATVDRVELEYQ